MLLNMDADVGRRLVKRRENKPWLYSVYYVARICSFSSSWCDMDCRATESTRKQNTIDPWHYVGLCGRGIHCVTQECKERPAGWGPELIKYNIFSLLWPTNSYGTQSHASVPQDGNVQLSGVICIDSFVCNNFGWLLYLQGLGYCAILSMCLYILLSCLSADLLALAGMIGACTLTTMNDILTPAVFFIQHLTSLQVCFLD